MPLAVRMRTDRRQDSGNVVLSSQFSVLGSWFSERKANYTTFSHEELTPAYAPFRRLSGYNARCV